MKHFYFLMLPLFFFTSCNGQVKKDSANSSKTFREKQEKLGPSEEEIAKFMAELDALVKTGIDPYFVDSKDTFSVHGPKCITRDLLQDKNGDFWLATWSGIIKYDGRVFTNYTLKEGLVHFHVYTCYEDRKGKLWFGTVRGGLYCYDGKSFKLFTKKDGPADNTVSSFAEDNNGNIWLGTESGVSRYDGKTFTNFTIKDGLKSNNVCSIIFDKAGKLWIGCGWTKYMADDGGITCYDGKSFTNFTSKDGSSFKTVASLLEDKNGNIWIGDGAKQVGGKGLCCYDGKTVNELIIPNFVMYVRQDSRGNILTAFNDYPENNHFTLYRYDGKNFSKIVEQTDPPNNAAIFGIIEDKSGNIWFGTARGVCRYDGKSFTYFTK